MTAYDNRMGDVIDWGLKILRAWTRTRTISTGIILIRIKKLIEACGRYLISDTVYHIPDAQKLMPRSGTMEVRRRTLSVRRRRPNIIRTTPLAIIMPLIYTRIFVE